MKWESVHVNARARETPEGRKSPGRTGGIWGPGRRWGHTCNAVRGGRFLYVFGGYGTDNCQTNDVHVFDTVKQTWSKPMMKGIPPSPRDSHSCTTVGNRLFVFGGTDGNSPLKDLHILDTSINQWIVPAIRGEGPPAREGHSAALVDKRIFIFGGCGKSNDNPEEVYYNDLYILDTEALTWERARTFGTPPCARDSHTCSSWQNKIIVLGGEDSSDCYLSDVHMLDAETLVWKQINTSGQMIAPRAGHATVAVGSNLFVFGGFTDARNLYDDLHVLNVGSCTWSRMISVNQGPSARFSVAGDCLDESKGIIVFLGGCNQSLEALDDMYYLHTGMPVEYGLSEQMPEKSSLRRELKNKYTENYLPVKELDKNIDMQIPEVKTALSQQLYLQGYNHAGSQSGSSSIAGKVTFEGRIVGSNHYSYTIETTISGQKLRGVLISTVPCSGQDRHAYPNKRRLGIGVDGAEVFEPQTVLNVVPVTPQELKSSDQAQISGAHGKESMTHVQPMEIVDPNLTNSTIDADVLQPNKASGNVESSLMMTDDLKSERRNLEPSNLPSMNMKINQDDMIQLSNPSENLKNISEILIQSPKPSDNLNNDSDNMVHFPKISENLENNPNVSESPLMTTERVKDDQEEKDPAITSEDLQNGLENLTSDNDEFSNLLPKSSAGSPCEMPAAAREILPSSTCEGAGEWDSSNNGQDIEYD